jgi:GT2 family glycosyltransferase
MRETAPLTCGIMITTHNRLADLQRTLAVIARLDPTPDEVLITADACTDGTEEWLRAHHAEHRLLVNKVSRGSIASRDAMMRSSRCDVILSLDDDSYPLEPDAIARVCELFEKNARLALASFPQRTDEFPESLNVRDFGTPHFVGTYMSCACAVRRNAFLEVGGYDAHFFHHMYEEPDFALRCVSAGWQARFEPAVTVRHHYSPANRSEIRRHHQHARNELWSVFMRCPMPQLFAVALFRVVRQFGYALRQSLTWALHEPVWWISLLAGLPRALRARRALPWRRYWAWMQLVRSPIFSEQEWKEKFAR